MGKEFVCTTLEPEVLEKIEAMAKELKIGRSSLVRTLILIGLEKGIEEIAKLK